MAIGRDWPPLAARRSDGGWFPLGEEPSGGRPSGAWGERRWAAHLDQPAEVGGDGAEDAAVCGVLDAELPAHLFAHLRQRRVVGGAAPAKWAQPGPERRRAEQ